MRNPKISRRDFLKYALTGMGGVSLLYVLTSLLKRDPRGGSITQPISELFKQDLRSQIVNRISSEKHTIWTWLRMLETRGEYSIPTSEGDYLENLGKIDVAMPLNGGKLQADGSWLQESPKVNEDWPRSLPEIARDARQLYMPGVGNDRDGILAILESPELQSKAADELVTLAKSRFDAPWDGVYLNLEGIPYEYHQPLSNFLLLLAERIHQEKLLLGISVNGRTGDSGPNPAEAYTYDYSVIAQIADYVDVRCYGYWNPRPRSIAPYWWLEECILYALQKDIPPQRITLGLGNFTRYWPDSSQNESIEITYAKAVELAQAASAQIAWVESNENGLVRERYANLGQGHLWIHDGETLYHGLQLIRQYELLGCTLFTPGMGDVYQWSVINQWRASYRRRPPFIYK